MNTSQKFPEVWLEGPIDGILVLLQPLAFALQQAREEVAIWMKDFPETLLWLKPAGVASPGFHLQHISGVLDRIFTYAEGKSLSAEQLQYLKAEGNPAETDDTLEGLIEKFNARANAAIEYLKNADINTLTEPRGVGRNQLPSTVIGLYTHAAEHTMRHIGQLLVTVRILKAAGNNAALDGLIK